MAGRMGLTASEATLVATAISELGRNIVLYAGCGEIRIRLVNERSRQGITVVARDRGPGIADGRQAARAGYTAARGTGLGLPGVRHIMDEFDISSEPGCGTTITVTKWKRQ